MRVYIVSIAVGVLVGVIYALLNVRSPAPPAIALVGLLGMLVGEQLVPLAMRLMNGQSISAAWIASECVPKVTGLPARQPTPGEPASSDQGRTS
jgi:XapX domain-containing protein